MSSSVHIRLHGTLRSFRPPDAGSHPITEGMTVAALIEELGIPNEKAHLAFVNGRQVGPQSILEGDDDVAIFPSLGGG